jgi:hypothetical protein
MTRYEALRRLIEPPEHHEEAIALDDMGALVG